MGDIELDWSDLRLFLAVARGKGLAAGAKLAGQSAPTLSRHMTDLELALGQELFERLPSGYHLTEAGQKLFTQTEAVEHQILGIIQERSAGRERLPIRVSAGTWMTWFLIQNIDRLQVSNRVLQFSAAEELHNIGRRETLIGIRNRRPTEAGVATRRTATVTFASYCLDSERDVQGWIACTVDTPSANWVRVNKRDHIRLQVTHPRSLLDLALQGAGHVVLPCFVGDRFDLLKRTGPVIEELSHEQWLVVHGEDRHLSDVRETIEKIVQVVSTAGLGGGNSPPACKSAFQV